MIQIVRRNFLFKRIDDIMFKIKKLAFHVFFSSIIMCYPIFSMQIIGLHSPYSSHSMRGSLPFRMYSPLPAQNFIQSEHHPHCAAQHVFKNVEIINNGKREKCQIVDYKHVIGLSQDILDKTNGAGVKIAVLDGGLNPYWGPFHLPLSHALIMRYNDIEKANKDKSNKSANIYLKQGKKYRNSHMHTLNVCNMIAGPEGIAQGVTLDVFNISYGMNYEYDNIFANAIREAVYNGNQFINLSMRLTMHDIIPHKTLESLLYAKENGVGIIFSAGNDNINFLLSYLNVYELFDKMGEAMLAAYGTNYRVEDKTLFEAKTYVFSNFCNNQDAMSRGISAPGRDLFLQLNRRGTKHPHKGTSFVAPQVTASAALLKGLYPNLAAVEIFKLLKDSSRKDPLCPHSSIDLSNIPGVLHIQRAFDLAKERYPKE